MAFDPPLLCLKRGVTLTPAREPREAELEHWDGQMDLFDQNPQREVPRDKKVVVFDLETQRSFAEVGGRSQFHRLGVSVGVAYRYDLDEFLVVKEDEIGELITLLTEAELVIGYNIRGFDYEVLRAYTDEDLQRLPTFDIMYDLEERLGFRPKLDSVASATLGTGKSADGLQALEWWRLGEVDKIIEYCREDVRVTRDLYDFGKRNRWVQVARFGGKARKVEVDW
jgi:DEAD/DEAH box helicase domain-containing protein